jgi:hypothetical protein
MPPEKLYVKQFLLFQKRSKSVSSASQKAVDSQKLGDAEKNSTLSSFFFSRKEAKALVLLRRRPVGSPKLGEADPGGLGASPQFVRVYEPKDFKAIKSIEW